MQALQRAGAPRRHRRSRVNPNPALVFQPNFGPGMGVSLAHDKETIQGIHLPALVASDHTCRDVQRAHQNDKRGGNVLTKPFPAVKPEFIGAVLDKQPGLQGVGVTAAAQSLQHRSHEPRVVSAGVAKLAPQVSRQLKCAWVEAGGQVDVILQAGRGAQGAMLTVGIALCAVPQEFGNRPVDKPLQLGGHGGLHAGQPGRVAGGIQHQQPGSAVGFQCDLVVDGRPLHLQISRRLHATGKA